jgi:4-hydroxybenzoate polyprenyltransferase
MGQVPNLNANGRLDPTTVSRSLAGKAPLFLDAIKFRESIFALPFAYAGMVLAAEGTPSLNKLLWITVAMVSARTVGMSANRILDRDIDALNPRTAERHLPSGMLRVVDLAAPALASLAVFILAAAMLNTLALALAPIAAVYLVVYPYTKRYTWAANLMLGGALGMAPSAAWIGVTGSLDWQPLLLSLSVALWASSFDILYHTQDHQFYVDQGLHSVAHRFGVPAAFWWARVLDTLALAALLALGVLMGLAWPYYVGWSGAAALLINKHRLVKPSDVSSIGPAFFRTNAYVSLTVFAAILAAVLIQ